MLKNTITIGKDYLQNKVKRQYSNHRTALIREFMQNSIDAGCTKLDFIFNKSERTLTVIDDGCGMDDVVMENALFQLGGSYKDNSKINTGGFGAAKLILLFQHEWFKIETWKNNKRYEVYGESDQYSDYIITDDIIGKGTKITIKFSETWGHEETYSGDLIDYYNNFEYDIQEILLIYSQVFLAEVS